MRAKQDAGHAKQDTLCGKAGARVLLGYPLRLKKLPVFEWSPRGAVADAGGGNRSAAEFFEAGGDFADGDALDVHLSATGGAALRAKAPPSLCGVAQVAASLRSIRRGRA